MQRADLLSVPGGTISYVDSGGDGPLIMLLHAGYVDHRMWAAEFGQLRRSARVVAPDARTHGRSSTATAPFRHCDDIAALVRHLNAGPAVLIGVSMGAGAAVDTALEYPELVRAMIISGAGTNEPYVTEPWARRVQSSVDQAVRDHDPERWIAAIMEYTAGPHRNVDDLDPSVVRRLEEMLHDFLREHIRPGVTPPDHVSDPWQRLGEIEVPTLGVVGALDSQDHIAMCRRAIASVQDGRGLISIDNAGHYPNLEQPQAWQSAVDDFLIGIGVISAPSMTS